MAVEIERKFLVRNDGWRAAADGGTRYRQGYLNRPERCSVRVRIAGEHAWLGVKSATSRLHRLEFEYAIPVAEAEAMREHFCLDGIIDKIRYRVWHSGHEWEVDCFSGANAGLVIAEIELVREDEPFSRPDWIGREVSSLPRYYNASLAVHPYRDWSREERDATSAPENG